MTFSILAYDEKTGRYGGAAATGSLCVGGWVLRGDSVSGMSASQGTSPSTLWGVEVLEYMKGGLTAQAAVDKTVGPDTGKQHRQLAALDPKGNTAIHSGEHSVPIFGHVADQNIIVSGNMLANDQVLPAILAGFKSAKGLMSERLLAALQNGANVGGDNRGLLSAALLVVANDMAPFSLRIDHAPRPIAALRDLHKLSKSSPYADWVNAVPTVNSPYKF